MSSLREIKQTVISLSRANNIQISVFGKRKQVLWQNELSRIRKIISENNIPQASHKRTFDKIVKDIPAKIGGRRARKFYND